MAKKKAATAKPTSVVRTATKKKATPRSKADAEPSLFVAEESSANLDSPAAEKPTARGTKPFDLEAIGQTAGEVWHLLNRSGDVPLASIKKQIDAPADVVSAALGWLAREGKLAIVPNGRATHVRLCE
jgi:hypothetical protein